jgi:hypothetical protein
MYPPLHVCPDTLQYSNFLNYFLPEFELVRALSVREEQNCDSPFSESFEATSVRLGKMGGLGL